MERTEVAILGGGLAGLVAARQLQKAGIAFRLLEARDRLGGRILSLDDQARPSEDGFDVGPSWFWPAMQPQLADLVRELGLTAFAQHARGAMMFERSRQEAPERVGFGGQEQGSMRLAGGTASLIRALAAELPAAQIHLNAPVQALHLQGDRVLLQVAGPKGPWELQARHVFAALPPRLLAANLALDPVLDPAIMTRWRGTPTWMAPHAKVFALYDRPFWREQGLSGMAQSLVGPLSEIHDATTVSGRAALFGFVGVPHVRRRQAGRDLLIEASVAQLTRLFGPEAATPQATLLKDWGEDALTATPEDASAGGHPMPSSSPWVSGPWADRLTLIGSETSRTEPGYLAGAVEAATRGLSAWIKTRAQSAA